MLINTILRQKEEIGEKLNKEYVPRTGLDEAKKQLDTPLIKVVTGPRRSGKSIFCLEILKGHDFAYANFDDEKLTVASHDEIIGAIESIYPQAKYFLFDEIQNLPRWELFANTMQRRGHVLILTGSNSRLLSGNLATHLTGRFTEFTVLPFSYSEYKKAQNGSLFDYLQTGGFPEVVILGLEAKSYLGTLAKATIFNDVVRRYSLRFSAQVYEMARYLATNFSSDVNLNKLKTSLNFHSYHTVQNYALYLEESFLFFLLNRFDFKYKQQIRTAKKSYLVDTGLVKALAFESSPNLGKLLENVVFIELVRRGYKPNLELFYYKTRNNKEVDFVLKKGLEISQLIQVCADLTDDKTRQRENSALDEAGKELKCENKKIITMDNLGDFLNS
ncbi:MAG: ATP-binding protein [bacterium]|nr:ATP-binding protein [bacterium]